MVKILILSDIHLEFGKMKIRDIPDCDVVVLAGDIGVGMSGWAWAEKYFADKTVLYIAGNHEFYGKKYSIKDLYATMHSKEKSNVTLLQNSSVTIDDVVFLGGTWWTNFELNNLTGVDMVRAPNVMNDYNYVKYEKSLITPRDIQLENWETTDFLRTTIGQDPTKKYVVVTHHAPCQLSCGAFRGEPDNVYYANTIDNDYTFPLPNLWLHGHVHHTVDYMMGDCRVVVNPRGYVDEIIRNNLKDFDPKLIVEI